MFWQMARPMLWVLLAYIPWLWAYSVPLTGDQKTYISIAQELIESHTWLQPIYLGEPCYFKLLLQYWSTLLSWKVLGISWFATLLPSVICLLITAALLNWISRKQKGRGQAGIWFAAMACTMTYATTAQMEIYLVCLSTVGWASIFQWDESRRQRYLYLAFVAIGLLALVKSPLHAVLMTVSVSVWLLATRRHAFRNIHLYLALVLGICAGL